MAATENWFAIYLKLNEASFFLDEIKSHQKHPRLLLFYLSAFLSSARSITFYIQSQVVPSVPNGRTIYDAATNELLNDNVSKFFINLRNISEKQMYLPLSFTMLEASHEENDPRNVLTQRGPSTPSSTATKEHLTWLEELPMNTADWPRAPYIRPQWYIEDFPGADKELINACETYLTKLRSFIEEIRRRFEDNETA